MPFIKKKPKQFTAMKERLFACYLCDIVFKQESHLKDHDRRHREKPFVCGCCTEAFAKRHERHMHSKRKRPPVVPSRVS